MFGEWTKFILWEPLTKAMYCRRRKWLHASIEKGFCPLTFLFLNDFIFYGLIIQCDETLFSLPFLCAEKRTKYVPYLSDQKKSVYLYREF